MKYQVLTADDSDSLERIVNEVIADGWTPHGGLSVAVWSYEDRHGANYTEWQFAQAMVKP